MATTSLKGACCSGLGDCKKGKTHTTDLRRTSNRGKKLILELWAVMTVTSLLPLMIHPIHNLHVLMFRCEVNNTLCKRC